MLWALKRLHLRARTQIGVRMALGVLQMAGAIVSTILICSAGVTTVSLAASTITTALTTLSIVLYGVTPAAAIT